MWLPDLIVRSRPSERHFTLRASQKRDTGDALMREYCCAALNYAHGLGVQAVEVSIHDARPAAHLSWQTHGFELIESPSGVTDWDNPEQIQTLHYPEIRRQAERLSGADHVLVSGHICRNPQQAELHADYAPIEYVHSDFAQDYALRLADWYEQGAPETQVALKTAGLEASAIRSARRVLILQFWRNVGHLQPDLPLAFADATSVPAMDVHTIHVPSYAGGDFAFDTLAVSPAPGGKQHRWYTFPGLQVHEVVVFRTYDSLMAMRGEAFWTPHTAFCDPHAAPDAPPRRSIEVRAICLFA